MLNIQKKTEERWKKGKQREATATEKRLKTTESSRFSFYIFHYNLQNKDFHCRQIIHHQKRKSLKNSPGAIWKGKRSSFSYAYSKGMRIPVRWFRIFRVLHCNRTSFDFHLLEKNLIFPWWNVLYSFFFKVNFKISEYNFFFFWVMGSSSWILE